MLRSTARSPRRVTAYSECDGGSEGRDGARCPTPDLRHHKSQLTLPSQTSSPLRILKGIPNDDGFIDDLKLARRQVVGSKGDDDRYCTMQARNGYTAVSLFVSRLVQTPRAYVKSSRDQKPKDTCDNERAKFNTNLLRLLSPSRRLSGSRRERADGSWRK